MQGIIQFSNMINVANDVSTVVFGWEMIAPSLLHSMLSVCIDYGETKRSSEGLACGNGKGPERVRETIVWGQR